MDKYTWDLTRIFKTEAEFKKSIKEAEDLSNEIVKYKGNILKDSNNLYQLLELDNKIELLTERIYIYAHLGYYSDMSSSKFQEYKEESLRLIDKISNMTSFVTPELLSSDYKLIEKYIRENNKLKKYELSLKRTFKYKKHVLSEKEEKLLSDMSEIIRISKSTYDALNNIDVKFGKIKDENGKMVPLTNSNYGTFLMSKNRRVRKSAFNKLYKYYIDHINTISSLYIGKVKSNSFIAKTRNYDSTLDMKLFPDDVDTSLYNSVIDATNKNIKYLKEYYSFKSKSLGYKLHMYDLYVNSSSMVDKKINYEDAIKLVNEALSPLGKEYLDKFNMLLSNRCVDVYPKDKKRSGAYEWGTYRVLPYVSLNYENNIDSVSTLAHEMGHAMHSYYSDSTQDYLYAGYPIFLAEIASTVNEILLSEYLINTSNNKNEKEYYLIEFLDKFKSTVYRQAMFAEFERNIHAFYESGKSLTKDLLCEEYLKLNKKHFDKVVCVDDTIKYEWARIPHFYDSFYVYKYATGFICALVIVNKLLTEKDFKDKYIKFLSSGSIKDPLLLLLDIGIDLKDENTLDKAFEMFKNKLDMLKEL